jgi:hypothetical protein
LRGKEIEDAAPDRKLAAGLDAIGPFITHVGELLVQVPQ